MKYRNFQFLIILLYGSISFSQDSTKQKESVNWLLYAEAYYSYDFNKPASGERPSVFHNHKRHNEPNLNLLLSKVSWQGTAIRINLGLMAGNYARYNLAAEPELFRHFFEANIGVKLSKKQALWLDAGILPSHIGFETAIAVNNSTLTRCMAAENSPYYETGIKLGYTTPGGRLHFSGLLLNGWQRIKRAAGNKSISAGTQVTYTPTNKISINWSTFIGNDKPDSARQNRFFNNFYFIFSPHPKWNITAGIDIGRQQKLLQNGHDTWMTPLCVIQYKATDKWSMTVRGEYYSDRNNVIIHPEIPNTPFSAAGFSFNIDRKMGSRFLWRSEIRTLKSKEAVFIKNNIAVKTNTAVTTSLNFKFE